MLPAQGGVNAKYVVENTYLSVLRCLTTPGSFEKTKIKAKR